MNIFVAFEILDDETNSKILVGTYDSVENTKTALLKYHGIEDNEVEFVSYYESWMMYDQNDSLIGEIETTTLND